MKWPSLPVGLLEECLNRQEVRLGDGKVIIRGQIGIRKKIKTVDIALYHKPNIPLAVIEAKAIVLTIRYDRLDNFWFTLVHELAHIKVHL